jgi:tetratricopeptide (TPR) repeat protein
MDFLNRLFGNKQGTTASSSGDDVYVEECLTPKFKEEGGQRSSGSDPDIRKVLDPLNRGDPKTASEEAKKLVAKFSDCDFIYDYWGEALKRMGKFDQARQVLNRGLNSAEQKRTLCNTLGEVEWESSNIKRAVYWWAQAVHCQESFKGYPGDLWPYLYLGYVAYGMGLGDIGKAFTSCADEFRAGQIRLNPPTADKLRDLARKGKTPEIEEVLRELGSKYLAYLL